MNATALGILCAVAVLLTLAFQDLYGLKGYCANTRPFTRSPHRRGGDRRRTGLMHSKSVARFGAPERAKELRGYFARFQVTVALPPPEAVATL